MQVPYNIGYSVELAQRPTLALVSRGGDKSDDRQGMSPAAAAAPRPGIRTFQRSIAEQSILVHQLSLSVRTSGWPVARLTRPHGRTGAGLCYQGKVWSARHVLFNYDSDCDIDRTCVARRAASSAHWVLTISHRCQTAYSRPRPTAGPACTLV